MGITDTDLDIQFDAWEANESKDSDVDDYFEHAVGFNTYQLALQSTLELLGTRLAPLPVIMPISSSPDTMSAVLRSGAAPVLLDLDYQTLQMNPTQLQEALQELKTAIVLLTLPGGQPVAEGLLKQVVDLPTIIDTRLVPDKPPKSIGAFTVYDITCMAGSGGVVVHKFPQQLHDLRVIRSGELGHAGALSWPQLNYFHSRYPKVASRKQHQALIAHWYKSDLQKCNKSGMIVFTDSEEWPYFLVRVVDAQRVVAHLQSEGVQAMLGCYPLHLVDEMKNRWKVAPEYPVAEKLMNELVALPTWITTDEAEKVVKIMLEVL
jgi:dTDP-4-amino-4,6-dideoxygalactose transaminase